jgi:hypothetical protein
MYHKPLIALVILSFVTLACSVNINLPGELETGPTQVEEINVQALADPQAIAEVRLSFGAGELNIGPSTETALITGAATYNVEEFQPVVTVNNEAISIEQGQLNSIGFPNIRGDFVNRWDIAIGSDALNLTINAGAYQGQYYLGGLAINRLEINDGAADVQVTFSETNPVEMTLFQYNTGASSIRMEGLSNANCQEMIFRGGAGSYTLDFSGELGQDMDVTIESGVSDLTIIVPTGTSTVLTTTGALMNVDRGAGWEQANSQYTISGDGYMITIQIDMGAGNISLETR